MSAQGMPPNLLALFAARPPLPYEPPLCRTRPRPVYTGLAGLIDLMESTPPPPKEPFETPREKKRRRKEEKLAEHRAQQKILAEQYDPNAQPCATKNPYATLFVGRISYETTEKKLKREFERYGPIKRVRIINDRDGKSRGYAFIEFESEYDLKAAYKQADGTKIDGRRVLVDVERARTVPKWLPRRLGGGKGPGRFAEAKKKGRQATNAAMQGGDRHYFGPPGSFGGMHPPNRGGGGFGGGGGGGYHGGPPHPYHRGPPQGDRGGYRGGGRFGGGGGGPGGPPGPRDFGSYGGGGGGRGGDMGRSQMNYQGLYRNEGGMGPRHSGGDDRYRNRMR